MTTFNRTASRIDWAAKARAWGIDLNAPPPAPEPVMGPIADVSQRYHSVLACPGTFRFTEQDGAMWTAVCDECRAEVCRSARSVDANVRQQGRLARANLPEKFAGPFERTADNAPALDALRDWINSFDGSVKPSERAGTLLPAPCLWGLLGVGKSHLLAAMCRRVIEECDLSVAFCSTRSLLRELQRFDDDVIRGEAWNRATTVDVLALDDLGAEQATDWRLEQLGHLIDERYQRELPILVATNFPPSQWETIVDARAVSRLRGMTFPVELGGADRRVHPQSQEEGNAA